MRFFCCCISFLKGAYTLFRFYYLFATLIFNGRQAKAKVLFRKTSGMHNCYLENGFAKVKFWFGVLSKLIRWNAWDQFQTVKLKSEGLRPFACYWDICFAFLFYFVSSASRLLIISKVRHVLNGDSPLIQNKGLVLKPSFSLECVKYFKVTFCG